MNSSDRVCRERCLRNAVLAGDEQAWQTLYQGTFQSLAAYVAWRCAGLRDLIEEITQDTWLTAVRRIGTFDPEVAPFASWLRGIAANILRNHFRLQARRGRHPPARNGQRRVAELARETPPAHDLPERIARALTTLPERYEAVLRAKYLDLHSVAEIAAALGETPKAIESVLTRARHAFREAYSHLE